MKCPFYTSLLSLLEFYFETLTAFVLHYTLFGVFSSFCQCNSALFFSYLVNVNKNVEEWLVPRAVSYKYGGMN